MNKLLVGLFLTLALATGFYYFRSNSTELAVEAERNFAIKDIDRVHRIFLADRSGHRVDLVRQADHWMYNGRYVVRPNAIENLLETLQGVTVRYKPAKALEKEMIKDLATNGIHVQVMDKENNSLKDFYVGGVTNDETGTYMIMEGSNQPYVTHINGFEGGLRVRFLLRERDWRDRTIFASNPAEIQSVSIEYPKQKNKSFRIERQGQQFSVLPFYDITPRIQKPAKPGMVEAFLLGFENLAAESFENQSPVRDSVSRLVPFSIITLKRTDGTEKTVRLHPFGFGDDFNPEGEPIQPLGEGSNIERYLADVSTGDFMLVQHLLFRKILWAYDFFY